MLRGVTPDRGMHGSNTDDARTRRREPTLGDAGHLRFRTPSPPGRVPHAPRRWWLWPLVAIAVLSAITIGLRRPIADRLWPETRAQELRAQAEAALARGHLSADDGGGARELYEAALAIDPDRTEAHAGLARVAQAALQQARDATMRNRFEDAHRRLQLARELSVPRAQADAVANALRQREAAYAGIDRLVSTAEAARKAGRLDGDPTAALPLYGRVLSLQPDRTDALKGREDALAELLQRARGALERGELAKGAAGIAAARDYDRGHVDLPESEALLARAKERARQHADAGLRAGDLQKAAETYRQLLATGSDDNAAAMRGLERVAAAYAQRARRAAADFRFDEADAALAQARKLSPQTAEVREAGRDLARARQSRTKLGPQLPARERTRRVQVLLAEAAAAEAQGDLLTPPGDSAYDKLRAARAIAPDDPAVRRAAARLLPVVRECFERELRDNRLQRARNCLDARTALEGASAASAQARRRLAQRWLAVGDERLGAGELAAAQSALDAARSLDPTTPGLADFAERVRAASASP